MFSKIKKLHILLTAIAFIFLLLLGLFLIIPTKKDQLKAIPIEEEVNSKSDILEDEEELIIDERINIYDEQELLEKVDKVLGDKSDDYAVYVKILSEDFDIGHNASESFYPASIIKVPIAILVMQGVEDGEYTLDTKLPLEEENKHYSTDQLYHKPTGSTYSVEFLLKYMIKYSDNSAWDILQDNLIGTTSQIEERIHDDLGMPNTRRVPFETTAYEVGMCFEKLYNYEYLSEKNSEYLLTLLSDITFTQNDRIPTGVPEGTRVAHKIGTWIGIYQDAGIVYGEEFDYVIVVLNRNCTIAESRETIGEVSRVVWEYFEGDDGSEQEL